MLLSTLAGRRPVDLLLVFVMVAASTTAAMTGFGAEPVLAHGSSANGCTGVPDSGYGFAFHAACDGHDRCYGSKPYGSDWRGRRTCDRVFRAEMLHYCERHGRFTLKRAACRSRAWAYYYGVRALGAPFWARSTGTAIA